MRIIDPNNAIEEFESKASPRASITFDELLGRMAEEKAKEGSIKSYFRSKGAFGYNWWYLIWHPWVIVGQIWGEVKFAWQRAFRGWDDSQTWHIDYAISKNLLGMLTHFKKYNNGIPYSVMNDLRKELYNEEFKPWDSDQDESPTFTKMASDKWDSIIQEMIDGFNEYVRSQDEVWSREEDERAIEKLERSLELLSKYYLDLWW